MNLVKIIFLNIMIIACGGDGNIINNNDFTAEVLEDGSKKIKIDTKKNIIGEVSWVIQGVNSKGEKQGECKLLIVDINSEATIVPKEEDDPLCSNFLIDPTSGPKEIIITSGEEQIEYCASLEMTNQKICGTI